MIAALLDAHYAGDEAARNAWLDFCEDNSIDPGHVGRRGVWSGSLSDWLSEGPDLVRQLAIVTVRFTDKEPSIRENHYLWFGGYLGLSEADDLPEEFFEDTAFPGLFHYYDTRDAAFEDASKRAIIWARRQRK
jgi:hypothetical protein